jgi:hypothetical protein
LPHYYGSDYSSRTLEDSGRRCPRAGNEGFGTVRSTCWAAVFALLGLCGSRALAAAQPVANVDCDVGASRAAAKGPRGYAPRGDRCEGTFNREVSGASLKVAGFYQAFGQLDSVKGAVPMTWSVPDTGLVHLRVRSMREGGEMYGMDTQLMAGTTSFSWPTDFLRLLHLEPSQLAPAAFIEVQGKDMYLPLRVSEASGGGPPTYTLTVISVERMERLFLTVASVDRVGDLATGGFVVVNQPIPGTPYSSGRPIPVSITGLGKPGLYVAQVLGLTSEGNRRELDVWFYHDQKGSESPHG